MPNRLGMYDAYAPVKTTFEKSGKPVPEGCHILDKLDELSFSENTAVIFISDVLDASTPVRYRLYSGMKALLTDRFQRASVCAA